jgi:hypothetical protein
MVEEIDSKTNNERIFCNANLGQCKKFKNIEDKIKPLLKTPQDVEIYYSLKSQIINLDKLPNLKIKELIFQEKEKLKSS